METHTGKRPVWGILAVTVFVLVTGWTVQRVSRAPVRNWDMLCYMALALEWEESDAAEVHRRTYEAARAEFPPRVYQAMLHGGFAVRQARYQDPEAFTEHLAFYRARVLYTFPLWALQKLGAPFVATTWWISLLSWAALAGLVLLWAARYVPLPAAALVALVVSQLPPVLEAARFSTPDALAGFVTCAGIYLLAVRRSLLPGAIVMTVSLLARPDNVILIVLLIGALTFLDEREQRPSPGFAAVWLLASVVTYFVLQKWSGHYGWWPVFWITFIQKEVHPSRIPTSMQLDLYWAALKDRSARLLGSTDLYYAGACAFVSALGLGTWLRGERHGAGRRHAAILLALLATVAVRYPLFPQLWARFLAPVYVLVPLLLLAMLVEERRTASGEAG